MPSRKCWSLSEPFRWASPILKIPGHFIATVHPASMTSSSRTSSASVSRIGSKSCALKRSLWRARNGRPGSAKTGRRKSSGSYASSRRPRGAALFVATGLAAGAYSSPAWACSSRRRPGARWLGAPAGYHRTGRPGAGAALVMPLAMALLSAAFPLEERGRALGIFSGLIGLVLVASPVVGGAITPRPAMDLLAQSPDRPDRHSRSRAGAPPESFGTGHDYR
jgi:MFS family permease